MHRGALRRYWAVDDWRAAAEKTHVKTLHRSGGSRIGSFPAAYDTETNDTKTSFPEMDKRAPEPQLSTPTPPFPSIHPFTHSPTPLSPSQFRPHLSQSRLR